MSNQLSPLIQRSKDWHTANALTPVEAVAVFQAEGLPVTLVACRIGKLVGELRAVWPQLHSRIS
jgi:hypothetical protein